MEIEIRKNDKPEIKEFKAILLQKNLSVPMASKITGFNSTTIYRWLNTNRYLKWKMSYALKKMKKAEGY